MQEHHITIPKTARFFTSGIISKEIKTVWIVCHGYAQLAGEFIKEFESLYSPETLFVAPEGLSRFYTKGFFGSVGATWMTREDRQHEIIDYTGYLQLLYEKVTNEVSSDAIIHVLGYSQGCSTVCRWLSLKNPRFTALWLCSGSIPDDLDFEKFKTLSETHPVHYFIGDKDPFVADKDREALQRMLSEKNLSVNMHQFDGVHELKVELLKSVASQH